MPPYGNPFGPGRGGRRSRNPPNLFGAGLSFANNNLNNIVPIRGEETDDDVVAKFMAEHTDFLSHADSTDPPNTDCPICYDGIEEHVCVRITNLPGCKHLIGLKCLEAMLKNDPSKEKLCPICRMQWIKEDGVWQNSEEWMNGDLGGPRVAGAEGRPGGGGGGGGGGRGQAVDVNDLHDRFGVAVGHLGLVNQMAQQMHLPGIAYWDGAISALRQQAHDRPRGQAPRDHGPPGHGHRGRPPRAPPRHYEYDDEYSDNDDEHVAGTHDRQPWISINQPRRPAPNIQYNTRLWEPFHGALGGGRPGGGGGGGSPDHSWRW